MRKCALSAAVAGAMLTAAAFPADAVTFSGAVGMLSAATAADAAKAQQVGCRRYGCWGGGVPYWPGPPYGLYQTYPYVGYNIVPGGYYYHPLVWPRAWGYRPW